MYLSLDIADYPLDRLPLSRSIVDRLAKLNVKTLVLSSEEEDLAFLRAMELEFDPAHQIMIELGWREHPVVELDIEDFCIYGTGATTDEAVENAINQFYIHLEQDPRCSLNAFKET